MPVSEADVEVRERLARLEARLELHEQSTGHRLQAVETTLDRLRGEVHAVTVRVATMAALAAAGGSGAAALAQYVLGAP